MKPDPLIVIPIEPAPRLTRSLEWHEYQPRRRWTMGDVFMVVALIWFVGLPAASAALYLARAVWGAIR